MRYVDTVQLATTTTDGYGDKTVTVLTETKAVFVQRTGYSHAENAAAIEADATVYLDPANAFVLANMHDLNGKYVVFDEQWYRITHVNIARRKLLDNALDNIYCMLQKEAGAPYVTHVS